MTKKTGQKSKVEKLFDETSPEALMRYKGDQISVTMDELYQNAEFAAEMYAEQQTTVGLFIWASTEFAWRTERGMVGENDHIQAHVPHVGEQATLLNVSITLANALMEYCVERRKIISAQPELKPTHSGTEMRQ